MKKLQCFTVICVKILKDPSDFFVYIVTTDHCLNASVVHLLGPRVKLEINALKKGVNLRKINGCYGNISPVAMETHLTHKKSMRHKT